MLPPQFLLRIKDIKMKMRTLIYALPFAAILAGPAFAQHGPPPPPMGGPVFDLIDTNKDGKLTKEEVRAAHDKKFLMIDANKDGFLAKEEMKAHHQAQKTEKMGKVKEKRLEFLDKDKNGLISQSEWNAANEMAKAKFAEHRDNKFKEIDMNKDGQLSKAELDAHHGQMGEMHKGKFKGKLKEMKPPKIDTNNDGKISRAEWNAMPLDMFEKGDLNKDGFVTREEAKQAAQNMGPKGKHHGGFFKKKPF